jgi:hypothetical protein
LSQIGEHEGQQIKDADDSYQDKVDDGALLVRKVTNNSLQIEEKEGMGQQLIEVARADFDGDGIEDMLVFEYSYATHGTFGSGAVILLTRSSDNTRFKVVRLTL